MILEYEAENVLDTQNRPTIEALSAKGIPYYVVVSDQQTLTRLTVILIQEEVQMYVVLLSSDHAVEKFWLSMCNGAGNWLLAKRPIKNDRFYLQKNDGWEVTPFIRIFDSKMLKYHINWWK